MHHKALLDSTSLVVNVDGGDNPLSMLVRVFPGRINWRGKIFLDVGIPISLPWKQCWEAILMNLDNNVKLYWFYGQQVRGERRWCSKNHAHTTEGCFVRQSPVIISYTLTKFLSPSPPPLCHFQVRNLSFPFFFFKCWLGPCKSTFIKVKEVH